MLAEWLNKLTNSMTSVGEVQELVRRGEVDVKETDCDGNNILHKVCSLDTERSEVVEYLVSVGAAVNQVNREGETPLIICAGKGYLSTLRVLLNNGACVDPHGAVRHGRHSGVLAAARNGHMDCVNELIEHGADIWYKDYEVMEYGVEIRYSDHDGENLLKVACEKNFPSLVKHCLENFGGLDRKSDLYQGLQRACTNGNIECIKVFMEFSFAIPDEYPCTGYPPVLAAAMAGQEDCVLELLEHGYKISAQSRRNENLMMIASRKGLHQVLKQCIEMSDEDGFNRCDLEDKTAIMYACENKQCGSLEILLSSAYCSQFLINKVSKSGYSALMICAKLGFLKGLVILIKHGALIEVTLPRFVDTRGESYNNTECNSALLLAAETKNELCVKHLLDNGGDIWYQNRKGANLLMVACEKGLSETVEHCLARGNFLQITAMDKSARTALSYSSGQIRCMKQLIGTGDTKMNDSLILGKTFPYLGESFLHSVCNRNIERPDIVELLVSHSSIIDRFNCDGKTALMLCAVNGSLESLKVLIKYKASLNLTQRAHRPEEQDCGYDEGLYSGRRYTAIMMAAEGRHEECVLELMKAGSDIWHVNNSGTSLLILAAENGLTKALGKCLDIGKSKWIGKGTESELYRDMLNRALHEAIDGKREKCALMIIEHGVDVWYTNKESQNAFMLASGKGLVNVVKAIVCTENSNMKRKNKDGKCALSIALKSHSNDCVLEILNIEILGEKIVKEMFQQAIQEGHSEDIRYFVAAGPSVDAVNARWYKLCTCVGLCSQSENDLDRFIEKWKKESAVLAAMACGQDFVNGLISEGYSVNHVNEQGKTLLMIAAERGFLDTVKICLERGSPEFVNMTDNIDQNAIVYACLNKRSTSLEEILKNKKTSLDEASIKMAAAACEDHGYVRGLQLFKKYGGELAKLSRPLWSIILEKDYAWYPEQHTEEDIILLISDTDIWETDSKGKNLLMTAVERDLAMVERYCMSNATFENIHATDNNSNTALTLSCRRAINTGFIVSQRNDLPKLRCLEEILKNDAAFSKERQSVKDNYADIDAEIYANGKSLLQLACSREEDMADLVDLLVKKGASLNVRDADGFTPLMVCAKKGHLNSLCVLLQAGADLNVTYSCVSNERSDSDSEEERNTKITQGNTALLIAATEGREICVLEMISHEVDLWVSNNKGENLLLLAAAKGWEDIVKVCLNKGSTEQVNVCDNSGNNAVIHACEESQTNTLAVLLNDHKCLEQINIVSTEVVMSPLMIAVKGALCWDIFMLLLQKGADPNVENRFGLTSLMVAVGDDLTHPGRCRSQCSEYVTLLLRYGAEVNHVCRTTKQTSLTVAIDNFAFCDVVQQFLERGADVNHVQLNGNTPLKIAAETRQLDVSRLLLTNGASMTVQNCDSLRLSNNEAVHKLLVTAGLLPEQVQRPTSDEVPSLYDLCRIPARQHVMNSFPNSNLFYMIPRLLLPELIKDFLLSEVDTGGNAQDDDHHDESSEDDDPYGKFLSVFNLFYTSRMSILRSTSE